MLLQHDWKEKYNEWGCRSIAWVCWRKIEIHCTWKDHDSNDCVSKQIITREGFEELDKSLIQLAQETKTAFNDGTLSSLMKQIEIKPFHIEFKLAGLRGLTIQIKVKDLDGKIEDLDVDAHVKNGLKQLTNAVSNEFPVTCGFF